MSPICKLRVEMLEDRTVPASVFSLDQFEANIRSYFENNSVGFAYAISVDGGILRHDGWGDARKAADGQVDFTESTRMTSASVAKMITATAMLKIIQDTPGITVNSFIAPYLPAGWAQGTNINTITFAELLTHKSGLRKIDWDGSGNEDPSYTDWNGDGQDDFEADLDEQTKYNGLQQLIALGFPSTDGDGNGLDDRKETFSYENANFALMRVMTAYMLGNGAAADDADNPARYTADAYRDYVSQNILAPMGIANADTVAVGDSPVLNYAYPDDGSDPWYYDDRSLNAGGEGWWMSADDYVKFLYGLRTNDSVLSEPTRQLMRDNFFGFMNPADWPGWGTSSMFGTHYAHGGDLTNLKTAIMDFPNGVQASLLVNSGWDGAVLPHGSAHQVTLLSRAYVNAWPEIDINGTSDNDEFVVRLNATDPNAIDIFLNGSRVVTRWLETLDTLTLNGLGGNDHFLIEDLPESLDLVLDGGADNDTFEIANYAGGSVFDYVVGDLAIIGGEGADHIDIRDVDGFGDWYSIQGISNADIVAQGVIDVDGYAGMLLYDTIEELMLQANMDPNQIKVMGITGGLTVDVYAGDTDDTFLVSDIASWATLNLYGQGGADTFDVWDIAAEAQVNVIADPLMGMGRDDTLFLGRGDLGMVQGEISFNGAGGVDSVFLDDTEATVGRSFQIRIDKITGSDGFGGLRLVSPAEHILLEGGKHDDIMNVESSFMQGDVELFGHDGTDIFYIAGQSHVVNPVDGVIVIHGGSGYPMHQEPGMAWAEDDDQVYVFDDENGVPGEFTLNQYGNFLHGQLLKLGYVEYPDLNVIYDQVERTFLHTSDGDDEITILAAPKFNQVSAYAGDGQDHIDIESTPLLAAPMQIFGEEGQDTIRVSPTAQHLGNLYSEVRVDGGTGGFGEFDVLAVYDSLSNAAGPYELNSTNLSRVGTAGVGFATLEALIVSCSSANNVINVSSSAPGTNLHIYGNAGNDTLTAANLASWVQFHGGNGANDSALFVGTNGDDLFTATENTITLGAGSLTTFVEKRGIDGEGGTDRLTLLGVAGVNEAFIVWPSTTQYAGKVIPGPHPTIWYADVEEMQVEGNHGDTDTLQVNGQTNSFGFGTYHDQFDINLAAAGTSLDPLLRLSNDLGQTMLTLTDCSYVGTPRVNGLLGADIFNVQVSAAGTQNRRIKLDGGGQPIALKGDQLNVSYAEKGASVTWTPTSPKSGKIAFDYTSLFFAIEYTDMEVTNLLPT